MTSPEEIEDFFDSFGLRGEFMADLGNYSKEFLEAWAMYSRGFRKIGQAAVEYGLKAEGFGRNIFMSGDHGNKITAKSAWDKRLQDTYCGEPISPEILVAAVGLLLDAKIAAVRRPLNPTCNMGHFSSELNKVEFGQFIEQAYEQAEQKRLQEGAN